MLPAMPPLIKMNALNRLVFVALCVVLVQISGINSARHLCDICSCSPSKDEPIKINCNCQESPSKMLIFKEEDELSLMQTSELRLSACNFLSLPTNGFVRATNLRHLILDNLNYFHFFRGVFPYLETLHIDRVTNLIFAELPLSTGKHLKRVTVKDSYLKVLPQLGLFEAKNLAMFELHGCNISSIAPGALFNANSTNSGLSIRITDTVISEIAEDGINIFGDAFTMRNTTITNLEPRSITAATRLGFSVTQSRFFNVSADSLHVKSTAVNVSGNSFATLPDAFLSDLHITGQESAATEGDIIFDNNDDEEPRVKIEFTSNTIGNIDLSAFFLKLRYREVNFKQNQIDCDCSSARTSVFKLPTLFPGLSPMANMTAYEHIIENNFCAQQKISLGEFGRQYLANTFCGDTTLNDAPTELNDVGDPPEPQKNLMAPGASTSHQIAFWLVITALLSHRFT